jgi:Pentapeptide repeats (8 copies)
MAHSSSEPRSTKRNSRVLLAAAQLQGASLTRAQLQGALLVGAHLQGASLNGAQLQGASLDYTQLQGALLGTASSNFTSSDVGPAQLNGASFENACVWRADARCADWKDTMVVHQETEPTKDKMSECDWTAASFAAFKQDIADEAPVGSEKRAATEKIEVRLDPSKSLEGEDEMAKIWTAREREAPSPEVYAKTVAELWRKTGCAEDGAPYVLHALIDRLSIPTRPFRDQSDAVKSLASTFLDEAHCPGAHGLSEYDKAKLRELAAPAPPPTPKP